MSKRGRDLTADEDKLWQRVTERVKPHRKNVARATPAEPPAAIRAATVRSKPRPIAEEAPRRSAVVAPPANRGAEKRVRRGKVEIGGKLDLHGHTQESGQAALTRFLIKSHARGDRTVIVITGVGRAGQGVLKQRLPEWLATRELRSIVSGFAQAHRTHGGAGAYYVFLKRSDD